MRDSSPEAFDKLAEKLGAYSERHHGMPVVEEAQVACEEAANVIRRLTEENRTLRKACEGARDALKGLPPSSIV